MISTTKNDYHWWYRLQTHIKKIWKGNNNGRGYLVLGLMENKIRYSKKIHQLTADAFLANPENKNALTILITINKRTILLIHDLLPVKKTLKIEQFDLCIPAE